MQARLFLDRMPQRDITGDSDHRNAASRDRRLHGNLQHTRHLFRLRDEFAIMAALRKQMFRMRLLEIAAPDFRARNLRCDRKHRDTAAMTIVKSVDQMEIARPATSRAHREIPGQLRFRAGRKRRRLFMPHRHPLQIFPRPDRIGDAVQRIAHQSINSLHARRDERIH